MGFGHALLASKKFVGDKPFLLHAGDAYFPNYSFLNNFIKSSQYDEKITATLLFQHKKIFRRIWNSTNKKRNATRYCSSCRLKSQKNLKVI